MTLLRDVARFGTVGVANTAVGLGAIWGGMLLGAPPALANGAGYLAGIALGFTLNRSWTFRSSERARVLLPRYIAAIAFAWMLNLVVVLAVISHARMNAYLAQLLGMGVYTVILFALSRSMVFRVPSKR